MSKDVIYKQDALDALCKGCGSGYCGISCEEYIAIKNLPSAQPEPSTERQEILEYLDMVLHPIISPEHWDVYSELHDMISSLPTAQPERKKGKWTEFTKVIVPEPYNKWRQAWKCSECGYGGQDYEEDGWYCWNFCPNCGADMRTEGT